jgi:hypothetical protein
LPDGEYGFELDTGTDGTINFNGNSEENLSTLNYNTEVNTEGTGTINYNG